MKAVILAGGEGTRLRPLTSNQPKPMMPIANRPMMEHIVRLLAQHGFDDIVVTVAFLAQQIRNYFGDGSELGVRMRYATEENPLGTAGSVRNAAAELDDTFLVISGDVLTDIDLSELIKAHQESGAAATIALKRVEDPLEFGIVITHEDGSIERFLEKPSWGEVFSDTINTGIYVLEPSVFDLIPEGEVVDFSGDVFPALLERGDRIHGHVADGYWEDVGTLDAYVRAHADILDNRVHVDIGGFQLGEGIWIGEGADVDPGAEVIGPVIIGDNCRIEAGVQLREYTVLGTDVQVRGHAYIERAVVHDHVYLGDDVRLRGCVIARNSDIRRHARIEEGVVLGDETFVGEAAVVNPGVKVYPFKTVEPGAIINSSLVWESKGQRTVFGARGVSGLANVDINPERTIRVAMAYASALKKGSVVATSRDTSRSARALKRAIIAGLNLSGVGVEDLELATVPLTRFHSRIQRPRGGITVRLAPGDPDSVEIRFFDERGRDIDPAMQRKIERQLSREDFRRAFAGEIGDISFPPRAIEFYTEALVQSVDVRAISRSRPKVVIDYSFGATSTLLPIVLAKLGVDVLGVNPYASTAPAMTSLDDLAERTARISELVRASGSHVGMVLDPGGETAVIIDDEGRALSNDEAVLALITLVASTHDGARVALPVNATREAERIATEHGASVVWTRLSSAHLMETADTDNIDFAADLHGGYIWPDFLPAFDAVATLAKLLDLLAKIGAPLSAVVRDLPRVHVAHERVPTPWERKGQIMRELVEQAGDGEVLLVDGIKTIEPDGWVLVCPDPDDPITHVWAEGQSALGARQLAQANARRIRSAMRTSRG